MHKRVSSATPTCRGACSGSLRPLREFQQVSGFKGETVWHNLLSNSLIFCVCLVLGMAFYVLDPSQREHDETR
jgi:hypothetical protein